MDTDDKRSQIENLLKDFRASQSIPEPVQSTPAATLSASASRTDPTMEPVAIIGLSGFLPRCKSVSQFWEALDQDSTLIEQIPASRFDINQIYSPEGGSGKSRTKWGGFIPDIENFDPHFFGLLPEEASRMDPQQRMLLMSVYNTLEDAGYAPGSLGGSRTGVFIGFERNEYLQNLADAGIDPGISLSQSDSMVANHLSYFFDFRGPSEIVNTMCSGGAVAIHRAVTALRSRSIDYCVVGATNLTLRPDVLVKLSQSGQMSSTDIVKSFGAHADGYLRGEGICSILLKRLSQAEKDGDAIYAVIKNTAINYNGRGGASIAAPHVATHAELIAQCYRDAGVDPRDITYIEAQGMGNPTSDIAEWDAFNFALATLAKEHKVDLEPGGCHISTLKPMTGHMHAASALGALFKVVRSLATKKIHKIIGFDAINPYLNTEGQPCSLTTDTVYWPVRNERSRLAGIHSFGAGGNNAHLLVEEYQASRSSSGDTGPVIIALSAKNESLLKVAVEKLLVDVELHREYSMCEIAHTLLSGRDVFSHRAAFVANSRDVWIAQAKAFLNQEILADVFVSGFRIADHYQHELSGLAELAAKWVNGAAVEWPDLGHGMRRLHLPASAFDTMVFPLPKVMRSSEVSTAREDHNSITTPSKSKVPRDVAEHALRSALSNFLRRPPESIQLNAEFTELGFDSLMVNALSGELASRHKLVVAPAVFFEYTSPSRLIDYLSDGSTESAIRGKKNSSNLPVLVEREPIAIIGLSGIYPEAGDLGTFWTNLMSGKDSIVEVPPERWPISDYFEPIKEAALKQGKSYGKWGGFIEGLNEFDAQFFNLSPAEAQYMHPKERVFMQCAWHVLEDAGYTPRSLREFRVGVFVGVSKAGFDNYKDSFFSIANRISYRFDFNGPSMPIDTACSSSLSAIHEACLHLYSAECDIALAGGVNAYTHPSTFAEFSRLNVISPNGKCSAFGENADGFVPGEGVGAVLLKPLSRALADGDHIYGVIRGTAVNHGGKANGYTAPNPNAHRELIRLAMQRAGVHAREVSYVEAHGTGTVLGDPVELRGLTEAFNVDTHDCGYCRLGSVKPNIGHLEAAAGIAGLSKVLLQMQRRQLVPSLHSTTPNPKICFETTPFVLQQAVEAWEPKDSEGRSIARIAGISSFGAGGSNAHLIVQEWDPVASQDAQIASDKICEELLILSAKSEATLRRYAQILVEFLKSDYSGSLSDLAFTLQVGREQMEYRLACISSSVSAFIQQLNQYLLATDSTEVLVGRVKKSRSRISAFSLDKQARQLLVDWFRDGDFKYLAELWVQGEDICWSELREKRTARRVSLPGYSFDKEYIQPAALLFPVAEQQKPSRGALPTAYSWQATPPIGTLMLRPSWVVAASSNRASMEVGKHRVFLCEMSAHSSRPEWVNLNLTQINDVATRYQEYIVRLLEEIQGIVNGGTKAKTLVQVVISNEEEARLFAGVLGLLKSASAENPNIIGQLIEIDKAVSEVELQRALDESRACIEFSWIRYAEGKRWVRTWDEYQSNSPSAPPWKDGATYLITGGLGELGYIVATDIAEKAKAVTLILTGRSEPAGKADRLEVLRCKGAKVIYKKVDVSDQNAVEELLSFIKAEVGELNGILHCAGVIHDAFLLKKNSEDARRVLSPKVAGAINLDRATATCRLDFFVLFSSAAGVVGNTGQADYAAANAFQDIFSWQRNEKVVLSQRSGRTLSIDWGLWQDGGMNVAPQIKESMWRSSGMQPITSSSGLQGLYAAMASDCAQLLVIDGDVPRLRTNLSASLTNRADCISPMSCELLEREIARIASKILCVSQEDVDLGAEYEEIGLDHVGLSAISDAISEQFGQYLSPGEIFKYSNLRQLTEYLWNQTSLCVMGEQSTRSNIVPPINMNMADIEQLRNVAIGFLKNAFSSVTHLALERIDEDVEMEKYGLDSLIAMQVTAELENIFGTLSKTLFFEYQTLGELADYFTGSHATTLQRISLESGGTSVRPVCSNKGDSQNSVATQSSENSMIDLCETDEDETFGVAIIGLAGRYPGANNLSEFWEVLSKGKDCVTEIPTERWDHSMYFDANKHAQGKTYTKWGGFIAGVEEFDAAFFNISPREAEIMEPQERLFLQTAYEAIEDAGYTRQSLAEQSIVDGAPGGVGVFVGVTYEEYQLYAAEETARGRSMVLSMSPASIANRVSYFCNFHGPSISLDTMCASSLTTIHLACQSIKNGECSVALAGGVNVSIHPAKYLMLGYGKFASTKGRCESFGKDGDGYVPSEGVGVAVLKPLRQALRDGDHIYGVIKGSAINHGGKTNGYSIPNPNAQAAVIRRALRNSRVSARDISYVEAHGTGTALGDPIEITGLSKAYKESTHDLQFCPIGSVKSNIGHCESAAGIAGLTKVLLQLKHQMLVPSLHSNLLNPNIDFTKSPFFVQQDVQEWRRPVMQIHPVKKTGLRIAGISSFGAGGSNAHLIVAESPENDVRPRAEMMENRPLLFILSAYGREQLRIQAQRLLDMLHARPYSKQELVSMAYTLQVGREMMPVRLALMAHAQAEVEEKLTEYCANPLQAQGVICGHIIADEMAGTDRDEKTSEKLQKWLDAEDYEALLREWAKGLKVDWRLLYRHGTPLRMSLPTYPFEKKRHWLPRQGKIIEKLSRDREVAMPVATGAHEASETQRLKLKEPSQGNDAVSISARLPITLSPLDSELPIASSTPSASINHVAYSKKDEGTTGQEWLYQWLTMSLSKSLYLDSPEVTIDRSFIALGLDSIIGVEWIREINKHLSVDLTVSVIYEYPTIRMLGQFLEQVLKQRNSSPALAAAETLVESRNEKVPNRKEDEGIAARELLCAELRSTLAKALYMDASDIKIHRNFLDLGLDSIIGIEWMRSINQRFDIDIRIDTIYQNPSIAALSDFLMRKFAHIDKILKSSSETSPAGKRSPIASVDSMPAARTLDEVTGWLQSSLADVLYMEGKDINIHMKFLDLGLDSIIGVEWIRAINHQFQLSCDVSIVYEYPSVFLLGNYLMEHFTGRTKKLDRKESVSSIEELLLLVQNGDLSVDVADEMLKERLNEQS